MALLIPIKKHYLTIWLILIAILLNIALALPLTDSSLARNSNMTSMYDKKIGIYWGEAKFIFLTKWYISLGQSSNSWNYSNNNINHVNLPLFCHNLYNQSIIDINPANDYALIILRKGFPLQWLYSAEIRNVYTNKFPITYNSNDQWSTHHPIILFANIDFCIFIINTVIIYFILYGLAKIGGIVQKSRFDRKSI